MVNTLLLPTGVLHNKIGWIYCHSHGQFCTVDPDPISDLHCNIALFASCAHTLSAPCAPPCLWWPSPSVVLPSCPSPSTPPSRPPPDCSWGASDSSPVLKRGFIQVLSDLSEDVQDIRRSKGNSQIYQLSSGRGRDYLHIGFALGWHCSTTQLHTHLLYSNKC